MTHAQIGARIESRRKELDMTLSEVAADVGVATSTIQRYEKGKFGKIKLPVIEAIANTLSVNPDWLIGKTDDPVDYDDPLLVASIPLSYMEACDNDVRKAMKMMNAVDSDQNAWNPPPYNPTHRIPILGRISAGLPLYAEQHIEGYTYTELNHGGEYFALRVAGDSMTAARINEGDILIVRRQDIVENGEIAVVLVDGDDATVKRFYRDGDTVTLSPQSYNPAHDLQIYNIKKTAVKILGRVVQNQISY